jgi:hypothetical protein
MSLEQRLAEKRDDLVARWIDGILGTYPPETQKVWRTNKDRFGNPVGCAITDTAGALYDHLLAWNDAEAIKDSMDRLVRVRAVQDFSPSQAVSFVFVLKKILREAFLETLEAEGRLPELLAMEARIDNLALMAFDLYNSAREQVFRMRVDEVKRAQSNLLKRARMIVDEPAPEAE